MRKIIVLFFLCSLTALSEDEVRLSVEREAFMTGHQLVFYLKKSAIRRWQNSNILGLETDYRLGEMFLPGDFDRGKFYKRALAALRHYEEMDVRLKKENKSINDLVKINPHQRMIRVNQFFISESDDFYKEINGIIESLAAREAVLINGVAVNSKEDKVEYYLRQKVTRTAPFKNAAKCKEFGAESVCTVGKFGVTVYKRPR